MTQIIPAILPKNQTELTTKAKQVLGLVSHVQVDVCDGVFVKSKTQFHELPYLDEMEYELDLMISEPELTIEEYIEMQPARIIIHLESVKNFQKLFLVLERIRGIIEVGLSISSTTDESVLEQYIDDIDFIQVMGISQIGSQGKPFDESSLDRIAYFHRKYPTTPISVDGAVNMKTIERLSEAGATRFVAGSAVFGDKNIAQGISQLRDSANTEDE
jgi:ribulose-phosphate 3-epimerase